ncbi:MAG: hypothetical protein IJ632_03790 [Muribaculaceae bacterium]|nr:hypothetical protein [Muribaculaceae bacterium]
MDFFHSVEFYVLALFVAFALLGLIVSPRLSGAAISAIAPMELGGRSAEPSGTLRLECGPAGTMTIRRYGLAVRDGEGAYLTVTIIDDKMKIVEKRGAATGGTGQTTEVDAMAQLTKLPTRKLHVRYDSEITGEWGLATVLVTDGNSVETRLKY